MCLDWLCGLVARFVCINSDLSGLVGDLSGLAVWISSSFCVY